MAGRFSFARSFAGFARSSRKCYSKEFGKSARCSFQRKAHSNTTSGRAFLPNERAKLLSSLQSSSAIRGQWPATVALVNKVQLAGRRLNSTVAAGGGLASSDGLALSESSEGAVDPLADVIQSAPQEMLHDSAREILSLVGEPSLEALGLGASTPVGYIQLALEHLHVVQGLPWWASIIALTVALRTLLFPLMVKGQINAARLNAVQPEIEKIQKRMRELANSQNMTDKAEVGMQLQKIFRDNNCHPIKGLIVPLVQLPVFVSFFLALRRMADLPVGSLYDGGVLWFTDLASHDPYFLLPIVAATSMLGVMELGAEAGVSNQKQFQTMKVVFRVMAVAMIPITAKFPAAIFLYWITSNFYSLGQVLVLKIPAFRRLVGLPEKAVIPVVQEKTGGFWENMKAGYKSSQSMARIRQEEKQKRLKFEQSLKNTNQKTYDYNPRVAQNNELFEMGKPTVSQKKKV